MEVTAWIAGVTTLAGTVKAWIDLKKSSTDLQKAKAELAKSVASKEAAPNPDRVPVSQASLVIDKEMLDAFVADILAAKNRFISCINDERYTPADVDREQERARRCVCTHLKKIREFNRGTLPGSQLKDLAASFRCDA